MRSVGKARALRSKIDNYRKNRITFFRGMVSAGNENVGKMEPGQAKILTVSDYAVSPLTSIRCRSIFGLIFSGSEGRVPVAFVVLKPKPIQHLGADPNPSFRQKPESSLFD